MLDNLVVLGDSVIFLFLMIINGKILLGIVN